MQLRDTVVVLTLHLAEQTVVVAVEQTVVVVIRYQYPTRLRTFPMATTVADIERHKGAVVHGALWSITPKDLAALDAYEGVGSGLYYRRIVTVMQDGKPVQALVYIMRDASERGLPSRMYLQTCATGYAIWGLPSWHLKQAVREAGTWLRDNGMDLDVMYEVGKRVYTREQLEARVRTTLPESPL